MPGYRPGVDRRSVAERATRDEAAERTADVRPLIAAPVRPRVRIAVGAIVVLVIVGLGAAVVASMLSPRSGTVGASASWAALTVDAGPGPGILVVHVLGAVATPGVYQLRAGARVLDAIAAAGGFAEDAARDGVNLATEVSDGAQVVVPVAGAAPLPRAGPPGVGPDGKVDLNTADEAALETLPRVGPAMAQRIIAYRAAHGGFKSVQDLLGITGIGDKTFAALEPLVTV